MFNKSLFKILLNNKNKKIFITDFNYRIIFLIPLFLILNLKFKISKKIKLDEENIILITSKKNIFQQIRDLSYQNPKSIILPYSIRWLFDIRLKKMSKISLAWNSTPDVNYLSRSSLTGHYVEFGTFWGKSFYTNYLKYNKWINGDFYAFDSFKGLPEPTNKELKYSAGDFTKGSYAANIGTFIAIGDLLGVFKKRIKIINGYYKNTLFNNKENYGLTKSSVSVCIIDCDLYESTLMALNYIKPFLENGALLYFDDYRLCRADRKIGERGAVKTFLKENKKIELVKLFNDHWQNQWFIFNRI